ncbi:MAG: 2-oxo acid dehydrogenase subunit E2 [Thermoleophilia bacterium]|nr:2-oxo acid dehydrogenase subunit E2 [Thermoleophilia bacterium]
MARTFCLPDLGSGLQECEILAWNVQVGDEVTPDQTLCEIETEKSVVEIPVPFAGVVRELAGPPGTVVAVGAPLVVIADSSGSPAPAEPRSAASKPADAPVRDREPRPAARPLATPLVRRLARERGLDLSVIAGSGPGGRVRRSDVEAALARQPARGAGGSGGRTRASTRTPLSRTRRTIASHLTSQWQAVPHVTAHADADATRLLAARRALAERLERNVPLDGLLGAAAVAALRGFPELNATVEGEDLVVHRFVDLGMAVAGPEGLVVPVVRDADSLSVPGLSDAIAGLTSRVRERTIRPEEQGGQTFTISNIGAVGAGHATQIIPAGTTAIVSFGRAREQPVVSATGIVAAPVMAVSLTFDHRAVDGAPAMAFLHALIAAIEEPALLLA